jgi:hypothetical protein
VLGFTGIAVISLALVWYKQESFLYVPRSPFQLPSQNNEGNRLPSDRNIVYEEVTLTTKDGVKLKGWHMSSDFTAKKDTVVFMHENDGNLG